MYSRFILVYSRENTSQKFQPDTNLLLFTGTNPQLSHLPLQVGPAPNNGQRLRDQHSCEGNDGVANDAKKSVPPAGRWWIANGRWVNGWWINFNLFVLVKMVWYKICVNEPLQPRLEWDAILFWYPFWGFWWCRVHRIIFTTILSWNITKEQVIWSCVKIPAMTIRLFRSFLVFSWYFWHPLICRFLGTSKEKLKVVPFFLLESAPTNLERRNLKATKCAWNPGWFHRGFLFGAILITVGTASNEHLHEWSKLLAPVYFCMILHLKFKTATTSTQNSFSECFWQIQCGSNNPKKHSSKKNTLDSECYLRAKKTANSLSAPALALQDLRPVTLKQKKM